MQTKKPSRKSYLQEGFLTGNVLLSQAATRQVPSTLEDFTSVFGMGTGVAPPPSSPDIYEFDSVKLPDLAWS